MANNKGFHCLLGKDLQQGRVVREWRGGGEGEIGGRERGGRKREGVGSELPEERGRREGGEGEGGREGGELPAPMVPISCVLTGPMGASC